LQQLRCRHNSDHDRLRLTVPLIALVLGSTAIPAGLRPFHLSNISLGCSARDIVQNLALYVPMGMVLSSLGVWRAILIATLISFFAEVSQFFMLYRFPSPIDLAFNVAGAMTGLLISRRLRLDTPTIRVNVRTAWLSMLAALGILVIRTWSDLEDLSASCRGATSPGSLEAHWSFDEMVAGVVFDFSGNGMKGTVAGRAVLADGIHGKALRLDDKNDYVDFGHPVDLRLVGSMTISAWINSASFPIDDAAIVSTLHPGYQLDTTVDRGPRTIGFKLVDPWGKLIARYGTTELVRDTWYHVAGVYDADTRTVNVYLNGKLDDGFLLGQPALAHLSSSEPVYVGRRADSRGFEFAGLIDDVRIYSLALTQAEIENVMHDVGIGSRRAGKPVHALAIEILRQRLGDEAYRCPPQTRDEDATVPGLIVVLGILTASACAGFWPGHRLALLGVSVAVGLLFAPALTTILPPYIVWMLPLLSLAGGASVAVSVVRASRSP
jgi:hypothetical protein